MGSVALILVRHGRPAINPDPPPPHWDLSPEGHPAVAALGESLKPFAPHAAISSPEPKALQTASIIASGLGLDFVIEPDLGEHKRASFSFGSETEFLSQMARLFAQPTFSASGDESLDQALRRFTTALARHPARPLMVVTHGTVLSLYAARCLGSGPNNGIPLMCGA